MSKRSLSASNTDAADALTVAQSLPVSDSSAASVVTSADVAPITARPRLDAPVSAAAAAAAAAETNDRFAHICLLLGDARFAAVRASRILVVGAGGVGCELLKNLVLTGFQDIVVLDLDTIDVSNLNRQFLFRQRHVGLSKSKVAREAILAMNPDVKIEALHTRIQVRTHCYMLVTNPDSSCVCFTNIYVVFSLLSGISNKRCLVFHFLAFVAAPFLRFQDPLFSPAYVSQFDAVLSALDNVEARMYLNCLCYSAGVGVIESGTHGFQGQTEPTLHGTTNCYSCTSRRAKTSYAVCTIRNTPDLPIHCIAWAKHLFAVFFGPVDEENLLIDLRRDLEAHLPTLTNNSNSNSNNTASAADRNEIERAAASFALAAFRRLFVTEIADQCLVAERWATRAAPTQVDLLAAFAVAPVADAAVATEADDSKKTDSATDAVDAHHPPAFSAATALAVTAAARALCASSPSTPATQQKLRGIEYYAAHFLTAAAALAAGEAGPVGALEFDKDCEEAVRFVAAAANLRMHCYGIPMISEFDAKGMAGAIVHALATTNAVVSGLAVKNACVLVHASKTRKNALLTATTASNGSSSSSSSNASAPTDAAGIADGSGASGYNVCAPSAGVAAAFTAATRIERSCRAATVTNWLPTLLQSIELGTPGPQCFCARPCLTVTADTRTLTLRGLLVDVLCHNETGLEDVTLDRISGEAKFFGQFEDYIDIHEDWTEKLAKARKTLQGLNSAGAVAVGSEVSPGVTVGVAGDVVVAGESALSRPLRVLGIADGSVLTVRDGASDAALVLRIRHRDSAVSSAMRDDEGGNGDDGQATSNNDNAWDSVVLTQLSLRSAAAGMPYTSISGTVTEKETDVCKNHFVRTLPADGHSASDSATSSVDAAASINSSGYVDVIPGYLRTPFTLTGPLSSLSELAAKAMAAQAAAAEVEAARAAVAEAEAKRNRLKKPVGGKSGASASKSADSDDTVVLDSDEEDNAAVAATAAPAATANDDEKCEITLSDSDDDDTAAVVVSANDATVKPKAEDEVVSFSDDDD